MPAVTKILIVFAAMLAATRLKVHLGLALLLGGIAIDLWAGHGVAGSVGHLGEAFRDPSLWLLVVITGLIIETGRYMTEKRNADALVGAAKRWGGKHGRVTSLMAMPAVIGLIPMPAGALFSAPFVEQASDAESHPDWKSAVNYWFRHVWEYWWPLYPGVILAMTIFEIDARTFMLVQFPFSLIAIGSGYLFLVRPHQRRLTHALDTDASSHRRALMALAPLLIVLTFLFGVPLLPGPWRSADADPQTVKLLTVLAGLLVATIVIAYDELRQRRETPGAPFPMFRSLREWKSQSILLSLAGVLTFKSMLDYSGLLPLAGDEFTASGVPLVVAVALLPLLAGLVTGIAVGFTGAAFPLIVVLMQTPGSGLTPFATLVLAYGFGYMGMMLSPVHLCLLVTRDYFKSDVPRIYRHIMPCAAAVMVYSILAYLVLHAIGV